MAVNLGLRSYSRSCSDFIAVDRMAGELPFGKIGHHPGTPPSRTKQIRAPADHHEGMSSSEQNCAKSAKPSSVSGTAQNCAGPPTRIEVWRERGS